MHRTIAYITIHYYNMQWIDHLCEQQFITMSPFNIVTYGRTRIHNTYKH